MDQTAPPSAVDRARALGPAIAAASDEIERTQRFPAALLEQLHAARLCRLLLPRSVGGEEIHPTEYLHAIAEIARHDGSVGWNLFVANSATLIAPFIPLESARRIYADPAALIAWGAPSGVRLKAAPGGYRVDGEWLFASGCRQATWMGAHGPVEEADGTLRLNARGVPLTRTVLFPVEQAERLGDWRPVGLRGTASEAYRVRDVFVPEAMSGTREEPEARRDPGPLYAFTMQGLYAVGVAGVALGLADAMLADFAKLAAEKTPRGRGRLADDALVRAGFATATAKVKAALAYLTAELDDIYAHAPETGAIGLADRARVRLAASHGIQAGVEAADWVHRAAGVSAIFPDSPFERRFRDIHTVSQQIQSRPAHFEAVGEILLGGAPPVFF